MILYLLYNFGARFDANFCIILIITYMLLKLYIANNNKLITLSHALSNIYTCTYITVFAYEHNFTYHIYMSRNYMNAVSELKSISLSYLSS